MKKNFNQLPRFLQIKKMLEEKIRSQRITSKLPAERELAKQYGVSYMTARRAVTELVNDGVAERRIGTGTFLTTTNNHKLNKTILFALSLQNTDGIRNPYFGEVFSTVEKLARTHGYATIFTTQLGDFFKVPTLDKGDHPSNLRIAGIIASAIPEKNLLEDLYYSLPIVMLNNWKGCTLPHVKISQKSGINDATTHLISLGHKRIAFISAEAGVNSSDERLSGYKKALNKANLAPSAIEISDWSFNGGVTACKQILKDAPDTTAIVCANDLMALGVLAFLKKEKIPVPKKMSVIGFGNTEQSEQSSPQLSTVQVSKEAIGEAAFYMLLSSIQEESVDKKISTIPTELINRQTTAPPS